MRRLVEDDSKQLSLSLSLCTALGEYVNSTGCQSLALAC